jgi:hypothetical protein
MLNNIFNEQMTSSEARATLFKAVEGKTKAEIEQIKSAYSKTLPSILEREHHLASKGWFID